MTARRASAGTPDVELARKRKPAAGNRKPAAGNGPRHGPIAGTKSAPALPPYKLLPVSELTPHPNNPRTHTPASISLLCRKIREDGWTNPIAVAGKQHNILAGHRRLLAALKRGLSETGHFLRARPREGKKMRWTRRRWLLKRSRLCG